MKTFIKVVTLISIITAIPVISVNAVTNPIITSAQTEQAETNQSEAEKTVILRTSWNKSDNSDIQYSAVVYSDNSIYVKCQSLGERYYNNTNFGTISFNDDIFNSDISLNKNNYSSLKNIDNYKDLNEIEYTFIYYHDNFSYYFSGLIFEFTLSPLTEFTEQTTVNLFGKEILLNAGEPDFKIEHDKLKEKYTQSIKLLSDFDINNDGILDDNDVVAYNQLKEDYAKINETLNTISRFDINDDGMIDAADASVMLEIYAINSSGGNIKTLDDYNNIKNKKQNSSNTQNEKMETTEQGERKSDPYHYNFNNQIL